jgi:hypothetical protein
MRIDKDKLDLLVTYIERWLSVGSTRNVGMLARLTGITSQTVRRILQKENYPELETALCLLNIVASPDESMGIVSSNASFVEFVKKISAMQNRENVSSAADVVLSLGNRERFWCYMLALTVGVTKDRIEKLCGAYGLFEFEKMIEEKLLFEAVPGEYKPSLEQNLLVIENKDVYSRVPGYISDVAMLHGEGQRLYLIYNVKVWLFQEPVICSKHPVVRAYSLITFDGKAIL